MANPNSKKGKAKLLSKTNDGYIKKLQESECGTRQLVWILQCHGEKMWNDCCRSKETSKT